MLVPQSQVLQNLSEVIPVLNETETILPVLAEQEPELVALDQAYDIIVVDNGSSDDSPQILDESPSRRLIHHEQNRGQGEAVLTGIEAAMVETIVTKDGARPSSPRPCSSPWILPPNLIKRIGRPFEKLVWWLRPHFSLSHRRAHNQMLAREMKEHREGEPLVVCDLSTLEIDTEDGRYYSSMVRELINGGFFPVFVAHRSTTSSFVKKGKKSLLQGDMFGVVRSLGEPQSPYFLITDHTAHPPALATKVIRMIYKWRPCQSEADIEMPYFVHPYIGTHTKLPHPYRAEDPRRARIFFGGNTTQERYSKNVIGVKYGMLTRHQMLTVATETAGDDILHPTAALDWLASTETHAFVMFETQKRGIPRSHWVEALANSDFYLACPGVEMPLCHNLIESMAGGAIPILQYAAYLPTPLENRVNAMTFDSADSLRETVRAALAMSPAEVLEMRANVKAYYMKHLAPGCFARRLFDGDLTRRNLLFNAYRIPR